MNEYFARSVDASAILRWWHEPVAHNPASRRSIVLYGLATCPRWTPWLVLAGLGALLAAMGASPVTIALISGIACGSYLYPKVATVLLLPVLVWSPKIPLNPWSGEPVSIRLDHAIVFGALLYVVAKRRLREDALTRMLVLFLVAAFSSTWLAYGVRGQAGFAGGTLYTFQLLYLASIFLVARSMRAVRADAAVYGWTLTVTSIAAYGIVERIVPIEAMTHGAYRTYERLFFDGQSNHIAGLLTMGVLVGVALLRQERWRVLGALSATLSLAALATTGSREGAIGLAAGIAMLMLLRYPKAFIPMLGVFTVVLLSSSNSFWYELSAPGSSMSDRALAWREALESFWRHPLFGEGLAARHRSFYDSQYVLLLSELGLVGFVLFLAWIVWLSKALWMGSKGSSLGASLCVAAFAAVAAVSVQGLAAVCLLITSIAGPLYWLTGTSLAMTEPSDGT